ncbi:DUF4209 domain-containing protein [Nocardia tengchongensis]|uniref:DUF4209 domain-containing protein n=1 Tax=Nocardia tengchongensis TaxID=2055889 RepID=UPI00369CDCFA
MTDTDPGALSSEVFDLDSADVAGQMDPADLVDDDAPSASASYVFDAADGPAAARVLDHAFKDLLVGADGWGAVEHAVKELDVALPDSCQRALTLLSCRPLKQNVGVAGAELAVDAASLSTLWARVADVADDEVALWTALADAVTVPAAHARLEDLLFARKVPKAGGYGRRAARAYLDAVDHREIDTRTTVYLLRAWTLARRLKDLSLENSALDVMIDHVNVLMANRNRPMPGALYPLLRVLCEKPRDSSRVDDLRRYVNTVLKTLAASETLEHLIAEVARLRRKLLGSGELTQELRDVHADEIAGLYRQAQDAPNLAVRFMHLETAAKVATSRGLHEEAKKFVAEMEVINLDDIGMEVIRASSAIPTWVIESQLDPYTEASDWRTGIRLFCTDPYVPTGRTQHHRALAATMGKDMLRLPTVLIRNGMPRYTLNTAEEQDKEDMARSAGIQANLYGRILAEALERISQRYGVPAVEELTAVFLELGAVDPRLARSLAKGFEYFWARDHEALAGIVIPKIEAAARALLRELDEGIYQVQAAKNPGNYPYLSVLLDELEMLALDEDWAYFLRWQLLGPIGLNLRNEYAHGFIDDVGPVQAALLLRAAVVLITAAPITDNSGRRIEVAATTTMPPGRDRILDAILARTSRTASRIFLAAEVMRGRLRARHLPNT